MTFVIGSAKIELGTVYGAADIIVPAGCEILTVRESLIFGREFIVFYRAYQSPTFKEQSRVTIKAMREGEPLDGTEKYITTILTKTHLGIHFFEAGRTSV